MQLTAVVDKVIWVLLGAALAISFVIVIRVPLVGFLSLEAFGALVVALLIAPCVAIHAFATDRARKTARIAWGLAMLVAFGGPTYVALATTNTDFVKDIYTVFTFVTIVLTFPSGFAGPIVFAGWDRLAPGSAVLQSPVWGGLLLWGPAALAGAIQWFVILPWIKRRLLGRRPQSGTS